MRYEMAVLVVFGRGDVLDFTCAYVF